MIRNVSAKEVAAKLGVSQRAVLDWARTGRVPHSRYSPRAVRFNLDEVLAVLSEPAQAAEPASHAE